MWYREAQRASSPWANVVFTGRDWKFFAADGSLLYRSNDFKSMVPHADQSAATQARVSDVLTAINAFRQTPAQDQTPAALQQAMAKYADPTWQPAPPPAAPAQPAASSNVTPPGETDAQRRARYTQAYAAAYEQYESTPPQDRMPFQQWKAQFDQRFNQNLVANPISQPARPLLSGEPSQYVATPNQSQGTYKLVQDAAGNVQIQQADGRVYAFIPASEVPYQGEYIRKMTGQQPRPSQQPAGQVPTPVGTK